MTEPELRAAVLEAFSELHDADIVLIFSAAKGLLEQRALSDPEDVTWGLNALDVLIAYFRRS